MEGVGAAVLGNVSDPTTLPKGDEKGGDDQWWGLEWLCFPMYLNLILFRKHHFLACFHHILPAFNFPELLVHFMFETFQLFAVKFLLGNQGTLLLKY